MATSLPLCLMGQHHEGWCQKGFTDCCVDGASDSFSEAQGLPGPPKALAREAYLLPLHLCDPWPYPV